MKKSLFLYFGLVVCTLAYDLVPEVTDILEPVATASSTVSTISQESSYKVRHPDQYATQDQDQAGRGQWRHPEYSQTSYQIELKPGFAYENGQHHGGSFQSGGHSSSSSYGSPIGGPPPLAHSTNQYEASTPSHDYSASSTTQKSVTVPPYHHHHHHHQSSNTGPSTVSSVYQVSLPAVPETRHTYYQSVYIPAYQASFPLPGGHGHQASHHQQHQQGKDEQSQSDEEKDDDSSQSSSGGAFSLHYTSPVYPVRVFPILAVPNTPVAPVYPAAPDNVHKVPPPSPLPQYETPKAPEVPPQPQYPENAPQVPQQHGPKLVFEHPPKVAGAASSQYEETKIVAQPQSPAYQVISVEAQPAAAAAYPAPAAPSHTAETYPDDLSAIPGQAGQDYPTMSVIPQNQFTCAGKLPGYYADTESKCQVWHNCDISGRKESFLCPNGTLYNQEKFVCDWWYNVDCGLATSFFVLNEGLYKVPVRAPVVETVQQQQQQAGSVEPAAAGGQQAVTAYGQHQSSSGYGQQQTSSGHGQQQIPSGYEQQQQQQQSSSGYGQQQIPSVHGSHQQHQASSGYGNDQQQHHHHQQTSSGYVSSTQQQQGSSSYVVSQQQLPVSSGYGSQQQSYGNRQPDSSGRDHHGTVQTSSYSVSLHRPPTYVVEPPSESGTAQVQHVTHSQATYGSYVSGAPPTVFSSTTLHPIVSSSVSYGQVVKDGHKGGGEDVAVPSSY